MSAALVPSGGFVLRTPLLPAAVAAGLGEGLTAGGWAGERAGDPGLDGAVAADATVVAGRLRALLSDPVVREAIWVASPSLSEQADRWLAGEKADDGLVRALLSYVMRMSTRCTPFGLFAACGAGEIGRDLDLRLGETYDVSRTTRLDYGFLTGLGMRVERDPEARSALTYTPNSSLYEGGGRLRMAERRLGGGTIRYHRTTFEQDEPLAAALAGARGGVRLDDLAATYVDDDVTHEDARAYLDALVDNQVLESALSPLITGGDPVAALAAQLLDHPATKRVGEELDAAREAVAAIDTKVGNDPAVYQAVAAGLREVTPDVEVSRLFQVDLNRRVPGLTLSDAVATELVRAIEALHRIYPQLGDTEIDRFRNDFRERFEDREVPLVLALDEELGIGFGPGAGASAEGAPLLAELPPAVSGDERPDSWYRRDAHLLSLLLDAHVNGAKEISLTEADLKALANPAPPALPDAVGVAAAVAAASPEAAANGDFRLLFFKASGPSGVNMLGRFCHIDPAIEDVVRRHVAAEEALDPEATYAEIVHLPDGRVGNIVARPVLREAEIAFLGRSGADEQIPLTDLLVSVRGNRIVLRSATTGREVRPRLTNAHWFQRGAMAAYRFLASLQFEGLTGGLNWRWGALGGRDFLPRVVLGRTVLARAEWAIRPDELKAAVKAATPAATFRAVQALRVARDLPRRVVIAADDNELTVDLDTVAGCELFAHEARGGGGLRLLERFPDFDDLVTANADGGFFHEIVVPFVKPGGATTRPAPRRVRTAAPEGFAESFPPGSEWLSAKLYCGQASTDAVVRGIVAPVAAAAVRGGAADGWFFLRYRDPQPHVRFRLHGDADRVAGELLPLLRRVAAPFADSGLVWRTEIDTYTREVDRYGGPAAVLLAERVFRADSEAALSVLLRTPDGADGAAALDDRWRLALAGVDRLFADLGLDVADRQRLARAQRDGLAGEFRTVGTNAKKLAGNLWRRERAALEALLDGDPTTPGLAAGLAVLEHRSAAQADPLAELHALGVAGALTQPLGSIALSYNHMSVIRMLRGAPRLQELVVYDLLDRLYSARLGRAGGTR